jgi:manganese/zinc/iron transport system permease protein
MSAMVVAPAAAARQWSRRLAPMVVIAASIGAVSGASGAVLSSLVSGLPTGPTIILVLSGMVLASLLVAPRRGLVWRWLRLGRLRRTLRPEPVLMHLFALSLQHQDEPEHGHTVAVLRTMSPADYDVARVLATLASRGLAQEVAPGSWAPTALGCREARRVLERQADEDGGRAP